MLLNIDIESKFPKPPSCKARNGAGTEYQSLVWGPADETFKWIYTRKTGEEPLKCSTLVDLASKYFNVENAEIPKNIYKSGREQWYVRLALNTLGKPTTAFQGDRWSRTPP